MSTMTKLDRCDRCGAEARHRFATEELPGLDLMFCGHHANTHGAALEKSGWKCVESKELVDA